MADTDQKKEDDVLRRMLNTPAEKHKPLGKAVGAKRGRKPRDRTDEAYPQRK